MNTLHAFGVRIDGRLHILAGSASDADFEEATRDGLPQGWVAWHVEQDECDDPPSARVAELRALPSLPYRWQDALEDARNARPLGTTGYAVTRL